MLPVSGLALVVREPTGDDEIFTIETPLAPVPLLLELARRVTTSSYQSEVDWTSLPATDLPAVALVIRRAWIGDSIRADSSCPSAGCHERIDVTFSIDAYLDHHRPRRARGAAAAPDRGWYSLTGETVRFRIPTIADLLVASASSEPADRLTRRCVEPATVSRAVARRLDRALAALAPSLDDLLGGRCPACGLDVMMRFDPVTYTIAELRGRFAGIYLETHALASAYGWPEESILRLPRGRRLRYVDLVAAERAIA